MLSVWSICMSARLKPSLCLPQGTLKSTTGVCWLVFLPSIQTSDQGIELIVIEQSPPLPLSSAATVRRAGRASSAGASPPPSSAGASRGRFRFGVVEPEAIAPPPDAVPLPPDGLVVEVGLVAAGLLVDVGTVPPTG